MQSPDMAGANGRPASLPRRLGARSQLDELRATGRTQAHAIDALGPEVCALRRRAAALTAENAELRAARDRPGRGRGPAAALAVCLPCDARAPGAARIVVD